MQDNIRLKAEKWLKAPFDEETRKQVQLLIDSNPRELKESFYTDLVFGTGGLRGLMGVGTNRMNRYTVRRATQGLANYLKKNKPNTHLSVVIGFDCRLNSETFAQEASLVLLQNGIDVFFIEELRPTPYVSFACRYCKAQAAIMITASHNPKEYNGYKVYWEDGAQVVPPHDIGILQEVNQIQDFSLVQGLSQGHLSPIKDELDQAYLEAIKPLEEALSPEKETKKDLKIVYSSLHGTGITLIPRALHDFGFTSLSLVKEQSISDGTFPTVALPNPEYKETLQMGLDQMIATSSDLLLTTDPDADRLSVAIRQGEEAVLLNGNETAALCVDYLCRTLSQNNTMPKNPAVITTIVSTDLIEAICKRYHVLCIKLLTGFKYIGQQIHLWEQVPSSPSFLFGAEESYGYLYGTHARDKDSIILSCLVAEMAFSCKKQNKTLLDYLYELYEQNGIFREKTTSIEFPPGKAGIDKTEKIMEELRKNPLIKLGSTLILSTKDFLDTKTTNLPKSNVLLFHLEGESKIIVRPSGTEPKLKIYGGVRLSSFSSLKQGLLKADSILDTLLENTKKRLLTLCEL